MVKKSCFEFSWASFESPWTFTYLMIFYFLNPQFSHFQNENNGSIYLKELLKGLNGVTHKKHVAHCC